MSYRRPSRYDAHFSIIINPLQLLSSLLLDSYAILESGVRKKLFLALTILTPALILVPNALAQSPTPNPQVNVNVDVAGTAGGNTNVNTNTNTNTNNINIQNTQNQTQTVTIGAVAVPRVLPATGASPLALALMFGAIPLGLYLRKYKRGQIGDFFQTVNIPKIPKLKSEIASPHLKESLS